MPVLRKTNDALIVLAMVLVLSVADGRAQNAPAPRPGPNLDLTKGAVVLPFGNKISNPDAAQLPEATRTSVIFLLGRQTLFAGVGRPEESNGQRPAIEISAELVDFAGGNLAKRMLIGFGTGRASATFDFVVKETATGKVVWNQKIKESASFFAGGVSSSTQRSELPQKLAKSFVNRLKGAKLPSVK